MITRVPSYQPGHHVTVIRAAQNRVAGYEQTARLAKRLANHDDPRAAKYLARCNGDLAAAKADLAALAQCASAVTRTYNACGTTSAAQPALKARFEAACRDGSPLTKPRDEMDRGSVACRDATQAYLAASEDWATLAAAQSNGSNTAAVTAKKSTEHIASLPPVVWADGNRQFTTAQQAAQDYGKAATEEILLHCFPHEVAALEAADSADREGLARCFAARLAAADTVLRGDRERAELARDRAELEAFRAARPGAA
jgi:hypothetical protein